jgi:NADH-quinone oxidoreductase subunit M
MPVMAFFFILFTFSSVGLPGLNGFASEFLTILGAFRSSAFGFNKSGMNYGVYYGAFAATGIILGAIYMLHMAARVIWGPLKYPGSGEAGHGHGGHGKPHGKPHGDAVEAHHDAQLPRDINAREIGILVPLAVVVVVLGVIPARFLDSISAPVTKMIGEPAAPNQLPKANPSAPAGPSLAKSN